MNINEAVVPTSQLAAGLQAGTDVISQFQEVTFTKYLKLVLPLDGFVFWVNSSLVTGGASALINSSAIDTAALNMANTALALPSTLTVKGSLHFTTQLVQAEGEDFSLSRVVFTAQSEINDLEAINPMVMYIGSIPHYPSIPASLVSSINPNTVTGPPLRFSFSRANSFYQQAGLYHYEGDALYPFMETQIIDSIGQIDPSLVVSNSLPAFLTQNTLFPVYPSYAVPDNIVPPYGVIHVEPNETRALQSAPFIDLNSNHFQLTRDLVRVTLYGVRNQVALRYQDQILQYSVDSDRIGIMNMPIIRDEKRVQTEMGILAQKKTIEFEVSYYQASMIDVAARFIKQAMASFFVAGVPL
jgi:hypothetical protein